MDQKKKQRDDRGDSDMGNMDDVTEAQIEREREEASADSSDYKEKETL